MAEIKFISECFVKPNYEVEDAKQPYHLSPTELAMLSIDPIQKGLLYSLNNSTDDVNYDRTKVISHLLKKLKHSLSLALVHFYPLAGRFATRKYPDEHACSIFVDCTKGPGARLIHASAVDITISDIMSSIDVPRIVRSFFELGEKMVNHDGHTRALLSIQVTELLDGVFIGFTMNHSVVDGTSFIHFVSMLSELFRSEEQFCDDNTTPTISRVPIFNYKPWIDNVCGDNEDVMVLKLSYLEPEEFISHGYEPGPLRERIFHFSPTSLATLKSKANQECGTRNEISSFKALSALVWRSITRVRNLSMDKMTCCNMLINARARFDPPISDDYFGNLLGGAQLVVNVEELLGHDLGWAAMKLHKTIMGQDGETICGQYKGLAKSPMVFQRGVGPDIHGPYSVVIGGSSRFDIYGSEFGLGRALVALMGYASKDDGKVTTNPGRKGGGSVDLEISLKPHYMAALELDSEFMSYVSLH